MAWKQEFILVVLWAATGIHTSGEHDPSPPVVTPFMDLVTHRSNIFTSGGQPVLPREGHSDLEFVLPPEHADPG